MCVCARARARACACVFDSIMGGTQMSFVVVAEHMTIMNRRHGEPNFHGFIDERQMTRAQVEEHRTFSRGIFIIAQNVARGTFFLGGGRFGYYTGSPGLEIKCYAVTRV